MDWIQVMATIAGNLAIIFPLWLWNRSESRSDNRQTDSKIDAIHMEMKDFHAKLCVLEERYIQLMQRMWENK